MRTVAQAQSEMNQRVIGGVIGGLAGGVIFGAMMAMMGMLPMIAGLAGSSSAVVGFLIHMLISGVIGASFATASSPASSSPGSSGARWRQAHPFSGGARHSSPRRPGHPQ